MSKAHSQAGVAGRHAINAITEFADTTARDAHVYAVADIGKVVRTGSAVPYRFWLITGVTAGVATFVEICSTYIGAFTASGVQNLDITGLDGDADCVYLIEFCIFKSASAIAYEIQPNGSDPTTAARSQGFSNGSAFTVDNELHLTNTTDLRVYGRIEVFAKAGKPRLFLCSYVRHGTGADLSAMERVESSMVWTNTATNITSLRLASDSATGFAAGSFARVWRRRDA